MNEDNEETRTALEQAIQDHFREVTSGGLATNWVIQITGVHEDSLEGSHALWVVPKAQPFFTTMGLVEYLKTQLQRAMMNDSEWTNDEDFDPNE